MPSYHMTRLLCFIISFLIFLAPVFAGSQQDKPKKLKTRDFSSAAKYKQKIREQQTAQVNFSQYVLFVIQKQMPVGGGYSATPETVNHLAGNVVSWDAEAQKLVITPLNARPSFCSAACYLVLLQALQKWEQHTGNKLPAEAWQLFNICENQADGHGVWGRANANGPGLAKLVSDVGAGVNFTDIALARPGDFLKIFWGPDIGRKERGHLVVYLGAEKKNDRIYLRYWSANTPDGYGTKSVPLDSMHHLIFTRITAPQNFANVTKLPATDPLLEAMLTRDFSFAQVIKMCRIRIPKKQK